MMNKFKIAVVGCFEQPLAIFVVRVGETVVENAEMEAKVQHVLDYTDSISILPGKGGIFATGGSKSTSCQMWKVAGKVGEKNLTLVNELKNQVLTKKDFARSLFATPRRLLSGHDGTLCLRDIRDPDDVELVWSKKKAHEKEISDVILLYDEQILSCSLDKTIKVFDCVRDRKTHDINDHTDYVQRMRIAHEHNILLSCGDDKTVRLFELDKWTKAGVVVSPFRGKRNWCLGMEYFPTKHLVVCGDGNGRLFSFDVRKLPKKPRDFLCKKELKPYIPNNGGSEIQHNLSNNVRHNQIRLLSDGFLVGSSDYCVRHFVFGEGGNFKLQCIYETKNRVKDLCVLEEDTYPCYSPSTPGTPHNFFGRSEEVEKLKKENSKLKKEAAKERATLKESLKHGELLIQQLQDDTRKKDATIEKLKNAHQIDEIEKRKRIKLVDQLEKKKESLLKKLAKTEKKVQKGLRGRKLREKKMDKKEKEFKVREKQYMDIISEMKRMFEQKFRKEEEEEEEEEEEGKKKKKKMKKGRRKENTRRVEKKLTEHLEKEEIYRMDVSRFFREYMYLPFHLKIDKCELYDYGIRKPFCSYVDLPDWIGDEKGEIVVCNLDKDQDLKEFVGKVKEKFGMIVKKIMKKLTKSLLEEKEKLENDYYKTLLEYLEKIAMMVCAFFGGFNDDILLEACKKFRAEYMKKENTQEIPLGKFKGCGVCRHRAILFKLVCDCLNLPCRIIRGKMIHRGETGNHAWNQVRVHHRFYLVDCSFAIPEDERDGLECLVDSYGPIPLAVVKDDVNSRVHSDRYFPHRAEMFATAGQKGGGLDNVKRAYEKCIRKGQRSVIDTDRGTVFSFEYHGVKYCVKEIRIDEKIKEAARELMFMRFMNHSCIIPFYCSFSRREGNVTKVYIVMKLMSGNLINFRESSKTWSRSERLIETLLVLFDLARGLRYLASNEIIHLDFKPSNILINYSVEKRQVDEVRICDFGLSKSTPGQKTLKRSSLSKSIPDNYTKYVAPEVTNEKQASVASDIFSFGKIMSDFAGEDGKGNVFAGYSLLPDLAKRCQHKDPKKRPSLTEILALLRYHLYYADLLAHQQEKKSQPQLLPKIEDDVLLIDDDPITTIQTEYYDGETGRKITQIMDLEVKQSDTVDTCKENIAGQLGMEAHQIILLIGGKDVAAINGKMKISDLQLERNSKFTVKRIR